MTLTFLPMLLASSTALLPGRPLGGKLTITSESSKLLGVGIVYDTATDVFVVPAFGEATRAKSGVDEWRVSYRDGDIDKRGSIRITIVAAGQCQLTSRFEIKKGGQVAFEDEGTLRYACDAKPRVAKPQVATQPPEPSPNPASVTYSDLLPGASSSIRPTGLTPAEVKAVFRKNGPGFKACAETWLGDRGIVDTLDLELLIRASGEVAEASATSKSLHNTPWRDCVVKELKALRFPAAEIDTRFSSTWTFRRDVDYDHDCLACF
jgi:hypothetical protein